MKKFYLKFSVVLYSSLILTDRRENIKTPFIRCRYVCPDLTSRKGYWARPIHEEYADTGNRLTFYYNASGQVHYFINNEHKGVLLSQLPVLSPMWAMFDFYGNTTSAQLVSAGKFYKKRHMGGT